jgi:hypothetical protein
MPTRPPPPAAGGRTSAPTPRAAARPPTAPAHPSRVDAVQRQQRPARRIRQHARLRSGMQPQGRQRRVQPLAPVVEIARHQQRRLRRHVLRHIVAQRAHLPFAAGVDQPQVHHDHVQGAIPRARVGVGRVADVFWQRQHRMQQAALLEAVVGHIAMPVRHDGKAAQQRIAMLTMARARIGAVQHVVARRRQEPRLVLRRPMGKAPLQPPVIRPHLLQADDVGTQLRHRTRQVVDLQPFQRPHALHTLVDVVGGYTHDTRAISHTMIVTLQPQRTLTRSCVDPRATCSPSRQTSPVHSRSGQILGSKDRPPYSARSFASGRNG